MFKFISIFITTVLFVNSTLAASHSAEVKAMARLYDVELWKTEYASQVPFKISRLEYAYYFKALYKTYARMYKAVWTKDRMIELNHKVVSATDWMQRQGLNVRRKRYARLRRNISKKYARLSSDDFLSIKTSENGQASNAQELEKQIESYKTEVSDLKERVESLQQRLQECESAKQ